MSITRIIEIQRSLQLDDKTMVILRNFDIDWNCGTRFILALIKSGVTGRPVANALSEALFEYKIMCQLGVSDYERLYHAVARGIGDQRHDLKPVSACSSA